MFNRVQVGLEELRGAAAIQQNLFPTHPLVQGKVTIVGQYFPLSQVGGDYLDYFVIDEEHVGFLIADVTGHGVPAALIMAAAKAIVISSEPLWKEPAALVTEMDKQLHHLGRDSAKASMTLLYGCLHVPSGKARLLRAGHPYPLLASPTRGTLEWIRPSGPILGLGFAHRAKEHEVQLMDGDTLILYTDGWLESESSSEDAYGMQRFQDLAASCLHAPQDFAERLATEHQAFRGPVPPPDDLSLVLIHFGHPSGSPGDPKSSSDGEVVSIPG